MNRISCLSPLGPLVDARFSRRSLLPLLFAILVCSSLSAAPRSGHPDRESSPQGIEVCLVDKIRQVTADKASVTFRILRDDDTWSDQTFAISWPHANPVAGLFFMAERAGQGWTLARVFTAAESKNYAEILQKKRSDKGRAKSLRQRLLEDFLTSVRR